MKWIMVLVALGVGLGVGLFIARAGKPENPSAVAAPAKYAGHTLAKWKSDLADGNTDTQQAAMTALVDWSWTNGDARDVVIDVAKNGGAGRVDALVAWHRLTLHTGEAKAEIQKLLASDDPVPGIWCVWQCSRFGFESFNLIELLPAAERAAQSINDPKDRELYLRLLKDIRTNKDIHDNIEMKRQSP